MSHSSFSLLTGPTSEPISLAEAKDYLRITLPALTDGYTQATAGANDIPLRSGGSVLNTKLAATWVQSGQASVKSATLQLKKIGTLAAGKKLTLTLKANNAGVPGATLGTAGTVDIDTAVATSYGAVEFVFATAVDLSDGTRYHLELTGDYTESGSNQVNWRALTVASGGNALIYDASWAASATLDFEITVSEYVAAEDSAISRALTAARKEVEKQTQRAFLTQTWKYTSDHWPHGHNPYHEHHRLELFPCPLAAVSSVLYYPSDGGVQATLSASDYAVITAATPGFIYLDHDESWPDLDERPDAVEITFTAGYASVAAAAADLDWDAARQAALLLMRFYYDERAGVPLGDAYLNLITSARVRGFIS